MTGSYADLLLGLQRWQQEMIVCGVDLYVLIELVNLHIFGFRPLILLK